MTPARHKLLHPRRSIAGRLLFLVLIGTLATMALLGVTSWLELRRADATIAAEREIVAADAARRVDDHLSDVLSALQSLANDARAVEPVDRHVAELRELTLMAWHAAAPLDGLFVATLDGRAHAQAPDGATSAPGLVTEAVRLIRQAPRPAVTSIVAPTHGAARVLAVVPFRSWQGELLGVVAGEIDPAGRRFIQLTASATQSSHQLDLLDEHGSLLWSADRHASDPRAAPIIASAALTYAPWRVVAHHPRGSRSFVEQFGRHLLWLGPLLVAGSLIHAWGAAWSVRRPLLTLTRVAGRLAGGDLATPIAIAGQDEVGQLGQALEAMRRVLDTSRREIEATNSALEQRVAERTGELERVNRELRDRDRVRQSLLRKVITAQEDERKRIARELHDEACQTVAALGLRLDTALTGVAPEAETHAALTRARELASRSLDELHRLMHALRPALLDDLGLVAAIRWHADRLARGGMAVRFESTVSKLRLPGEIEMAVFRAVQEVLTNIERHSQADMVLVEVMIDRGDLLIDIEDDGVGFDLEGLMVTPENGRGLGLLGIRERMDLAGGTVEIHSAPGRGTHVAIRVPVPEGVLDGEDPGADR